MVTQGGKSLRLTPCLSIPDVIIGQSYKADYLVLATGFDVVSRIKLAKVAETSRLTKPRLRASTLLGVTKSRQKRGSVIIPRCTTV